MKRVLIAIDDGPAAEKILLEGCSLAGKLDADVGVVTVADTNYLMTDGTLSPDELADLIKSRTIINQEKIVNKMFKENKIRTFMEEGRPFEAILKVAELWEADLLVLGTHGRKGLEHLFLGSVAEKVTRHSKIPLYIIPVSS